ncbi:MAG: NAD(P)H-dependent oxidoreductase [Bacteriovorax sp.]|nr:NAD(P)H-dependent oxidoreductase [Bacteriovorax sp.]
MKKILILNGSISGADGNTQHLIKLVQEKIENCEVLHLKDLQEKKITIGELKNKLKKADGFIFTSGTYWDSWGSPMQHFLEVATEFEAGDMFMGKPAAVIITMHSVGGKGVLSRLQGVLNTLGILIPPMSGMVYSLAGHLALQTESSFAEDFWSLEDTNVIIHNLMASLGNKKYQSWPVDHKDPKRIWIK